MMLHLCDKHGIRYIVRQAQNSRLDKLLESTMEQAKEEYGKSQEK